MSKTLVTVNLFAGFRALIGGQASIEVEIEPGQTICQTLESIGVPPEQTRIVFIESRAVEMTRTLEGGESLGVFPAIGGG